MTNTEQFEQDAMDNGVVDLETLRHEEQDVYQEALIDELDREDNISVA